MQIRPKNILFSADQRTAEAISTITQSMWPTTQQAAIYHAVNFYASLISLGLLPTVKQQLRQAALNPPERPATEVKDEHGNFPSDYVELPE